MRGLFAFLALIVIAAIAVSYSRGWFAFTTTRDEQNVNIHMTVDKEKVKEDEGRAKEKIQKLGGQIKEGAEKLSEKVKEGTHGKKADDSHP